MAREHGGIRLWLPSWTKVRSRLSIITLAVSLGGVAYAPTRASAKDAAPAPALRWVTSESEALRLAAERAQPVLIDFWADWCAACDALDRLVWSDQQVREAARHFIAVRLDGSLSSASARDGRFDRAADRYRVLGLPTVILTDARGRVLDHIIGVVSADEMVRRLQAAERSCTAVMACR